MKKIIKKERLEKEKTKKSKSTEESNNNQMDIEEGNDKKNEKELCRIHLNQK